MSKKQIFIEWLDVLVGQNPTQVPEEVKEYLEILKGTKADTEKPAFTAIGLQIMKFLQEFEVSPNADDSADKADPMSARAIAEGLFLSSRSVSGATRKLITDGYVEKCGTDPVIYQLTESGKTVVLP